MEKNMFQLYKECWKNYFNVKGTLSKENYWKGCIPVSFFCYFFHILLWGIWLAPIAEDLSETRSMLYVISSNLFLIIFFIPWFTASVRRMRDIGVSPWWALLSFGIFFSFLSFLVIIVLVICGNDRKSS
ncbi:DUF805 domain-containing protein [Basilea psittacipulmonis]|uniref:DUF805 domain-containing protein n=1 Tax=Basilea psittacipulmonis TaxID=1472345 RepID=UPI000570D948|nr:DUF805 domain-containing protein [Basilea psittacipulmonis]